MTTSVAPPPAGTAPGAAVGGGDCVARPGPLCAECLATYFVDRVDGGTSVALSFDEAQAVQRLARAGLIPQPQHRVAA